MAWKNNYVDDEPKLSKYNAALAQLYRIDDLWQVANLHSRSGQLIQWNWDLDVIWRELAGDANKDDFIEYNRINKQIIINRKKRGLLYQTLQEKEIFLRKLQNKQGKGTAYYEDDEGL